MITGLNPWLWAAAGLMVALLGPLWVCFHGSAGDRLAGLEMGSCLITLDLLLFVKGFNRASFFDLPLTLSLLSFGGGLVFARFLQRWL